MIIGISGKIGSGKSTLARILHDVYGYRPHAFAHKLKQMAALFTGMSVESMYDRQVKNTYLPDWGMTVGALQQKLGTDAVRFNLHGDAWINALFVDYTGAPWVVDDVRFPNEVRAIKERGGIVVRIDGSRTGAQGRNAEHPSETALDYYDAFDYRFTNDSDMIDLHKHARQIVEMIEA